MLNGGGEERSNFPGESGRGKDKEIGFEQGKGSIYGSSDSGRRGRGCPHWAVEVESREKNSRHGASGKCVR